MIDRLFFYDNRISILTIGFPIIILDSFIEKEVLWLVEPYPSKGKVFVNKNVTNFSNLLIPIVIDLSFVDIEKLKLPYNVIFWIDSVNLIPPGLMIAVRDIVLWKGSFFKLVKYRYRFL